MKNSNKEEFLSEILTDEELADFQQASLLKGIVLLRRQRRRRLAWRASLASISLCVIALGIAWNLKSPSLRAKLAPTAPSERQIAPEPSSAIKHLSDDELLDLFPNRAVALIGTPGHQRLLFLDQGPRHPAK